MSDKCGKMVFPVGNVAVRESEDIGRLLDLRSSGKDLVLSENGPVVRHHGCRNCPHYGSTFCFEKVIPPSVHLGGICLGRVNEILDNAEICGSADGLLIRKTEAVERIRKYIILLENNLNDYRLKRMELKPELGKVVLQQQKDETREEFDVRILSKDLDLMKFDSYEAALIGQIEKLSGEYAKFLQEDEKVKAKDDSIGRSMNIQELNVFLNNTQKELHDMKRVRDGGSND